MSKMRLPYARGSVTLTSRFGWRTLNGASDYHKGIDLVGSDKTLVAPCDGTVMVSTMLDKRWDKTLTWQWGNYIRIDTADGLNIYMCHMAERKVKAGQKVKAGDIVGIEGNTGYSFGSHCHFEIRRNGTSLDPTEFLGIQNAWGVHPVISSVSTGKTFADDYEHDGLRFHKAEDFRIVYHDLNKKKGSGDTYANGGFFAYFKENGVNFTLPVANLVCDINRSFISDPTKKYLSPYIFGSKLYYGCNNNQTVQFKNKAVSTLVVPKIGRPYIDDLIAPPSDCLYAISGVPTVRYGDDVDYYNYVKRQGWDDSCMYGTYRNWLGVRDGEIWVITGRTWRNNYIYGMEFWNKVKNEGFDDVICLDGGGSYYCKIDGKAQSTIGTRSVNNIITF